MVIARGGFGAARLWVDGVRFPMHQIFVKSVLDVGRRQWNSMQSRGVGFILREQEFVGARAIKNIVAELPMFDGKRSESALEPALVFADGDQRPALVAPPTPGVAEPECRQHLNRGHLRTAVADADT